MKNILITLLIFIYSQSFAQKQDTIYYVGPGSLVMIVDSENFENYVTLVDENFLFTKKRPDRIWVEYAEGGYNWSHNPKDLDGTQAYWIYTSDIIEEKKIKSNKRKVFINCANFHQFFTTKKPNTKKFKRDLRRSLKKMG